MSLVGRSATFADCAEAVTICPRPPQAAIGGSSAVRRGGAGRAEADGTLSDASARLLGNAFTNGAGSIIVADFNGDGLDDQMLPAINANPFIWKNSTAWISRPPGGLDKLTPVDNVMNHDARPVVLEAGQYNSFDERRV